MRFVAAMLIAAVLLGSVAWCQYAMTQGIDVQLTRSMHDDAAMAEDPVSGPGYELVLTPGFDAEQDPFALDVGEGTARLVVREGDRELLRHRQDLRRGEEVRVGNLRFAGNPVVLFVEAVPTAEAAANPCALRVQVMRGDTLMAETTLWSAGGGVPIARAVELELKPRRERLDRGLGREAT
jgi:hypothetical protein